MDFQWMEDTQLGLQLGTNVTQDTTQLRGPLADAGVMDGETHLSNVKVKNKKWQILKYVQSLWFMPSTLYFYRQLVKITLFILVP